jgi:ABC-type antimicrobial peptide transport system permease subunit
VFTSGLCVVGLVSQLGLELAHRAREFAVRLAVGAEPRHIRRSVLRKAAARMLVGVGAGAAPGAAATRSLESMLVGVRPADPVTWAWVVATVCVVVLGTSYVMTRRAASMNPATVLRRE